MALDDPLADGQANTGPLVFAPAVQPLEDAEDPLGILLVEAEPVEGSSVRAAKYLDTAASAFRKIAS